MADLSVGLLRRHRAFRGYWLGQSLSFVGTQVTAVALPLVAALTLSAGPGQVAAIGHGRDAAQPAFFALGRALGGRS